MEQSGYKSSADSIIAASKLLKTSLRFTPHHLPTVTQSHAAAADKSTTKRRQATPNKKEVGRRTEEVTTKLAGARETTATGGDGNVVDAGGKAPASIYNSACNSVDTRRHNFKHIFDDIFSLWYDYFGATALAWMTVPVSFYIVHIFSELFGFAGTANKSILKVAITLVVYYLRISISICVLSILGVPLMKLVEILQNPSKGSKLGVFLLFIFIVSYFIFIIHMSPTI